MTILRVALDVPLPTLFDYRSEDATPADIGYRALVPFGKKRLVGLIWDVATKSKVTDSRLRSVEKILREAAPLRRRHDHRQRRSPLRLDRIERAEDRIGLQHHPRSSAVRHVVHDAVAIGREVAQVAHLHVERPTIDRAAENPHGQRLLDHRRKDRDDVERHRAFNSSSPGGGSITIARCVVDIPPVPNLPPGAAIRPTELGMWIAIVQDIRYAGSHNFVGRPIKGYLAAECILSAPAAIKDYFERATAVRVMVANSPP